MTGVIFLLEHEKFTVFGQGEEVYFHLWVREKLPFFNIFFMEMGAFLTKSQGKLFFGNAGNPARHRLMERSAKKQIKISCTFQR